MSTAPPKPIVSLRADDPEWDDAISSFVVSLGERLDAFQDAELAGDPGVLTRLAETLHDDAQQLGYPGPADAARRIRSAGQDPAPDAVHKSIVHLTELVQRVRRGHRSSAA